MGQETRRGREALVSEHVKVVTETRAELGLPTLTEAEIRAGLEQERPEDQEGFGGYSGRCGCPLFVRHETSCPFRERGYEPYAPLAGRLEFDGFAKTRFIVRDPNGFAVEPGTYPAAITVVTGSHGEITVDFIVTGERTGD